MFKRKKKTKKRVKKAVSSEKKLKYKYGKIGFGGKKDLNYFIENLAMLVSSGMTISSAIGFISKEVKSKSMKNILSGIQEDLSSGTPLWKTFKKSGLFASHTISLVRIGEESSSLTDNLKLVSIKEEKDRAFRSKLRSAMMYPGFVFTVTLVVGVLVSWFILPKLADVFNQLNVTLPTITKFLINTGQFLSVKGVIVVPTAFALIFAFVYFIFLNKKTKHIGQNMLFKAPGIGRLLKEVELTRFGYLLGTLLAAGIPIISALDSLEKATDLQKYKRFYSFLLESIKEGNSFKKSFENFEKTSDFIPSTIQGLIVAGEQSGSLSKTLLKFSERYEIKIEDTTKNLSVIFEPILLVIVWLGVVVVAMSVMLPIYSLIGGFSV